MPFPPHRTKVIYGPPGTGKTSTLIATVESFIEKGISPKNIAYLTFTRKAANVAKTRAIARFGCHSDDLPYFQTLHAFAYHALGVQRGGLIDAPDYILLAKALKIRIDSHRRRNHELIPCPATDGDKLIDCEANARAKQVALRAYWEGLPREGIDWTELQAWAQTYSKYKQDTGKLDFVDLLSRYLETGTVPPIEVLIIDEAQDLTPLQWKVAEKLAEGASKIIVAGDDDQSIYRWAGSDHTKMFELTHDQLVLPRSYRVPENIQRVANAIVKRIKVRKEKQWEPNSKGGVVRYERDLRHIDIDPSQGTWLLLARSRYQLEDYVEHCTQRNLLFECPFSETIRATTIQAITTWEQLKAGMAVTAEDAKNLYTYTTSGFQVKNGFKKALNEVPDAELLTLHQLQAHYGLVATHAWNWGDVIHRVSTEEKGYLFDVSQRGSLINGAPIRISTIHGAKGGEADNVVVMEDISRKASRGMKIDPADEHRTFYVAVTRAKKSLHVITQHTGTYYKIP